LCGGVDIGPKSGLCVVAAHRWQNSLIRQSIAEILSRKKKLRKDAVIVSLTASDEEHIKSEKDFLVMPNRMNVSFTRPRTKLIVVGSRSLFRVIPANCD